MIFTEQHPPPHLSSSLAAFRRSPGVVAIEKWACRADTAVSAQFSTSSLCSNCSTSPWRRRSQEGRSICFTTSFTEAENASMHIHIHTHVRNYHFLHLHVLCKQYGGSIPHPQVSTLDPYWCTRAHTTNLQSRWVLAAAGWLSERWSKLGYALSQQAPETHKHLYYRLIQPPDSLCNNTYFFKIK